MRDRGGTSADLGAPSPESAEDPLHLPVYVHRRSPGRLDSVCVPPPRSTIASEARDGGTPAPDSVDPEDLELAVLDLAFLLRLESETDGYRVVGAEPESAIFGFYDNAGEHVLELDVAADEVEACLLDQIRDRVGRVRGAVPGGRARVRYPIRLVYRYPRAR